MSINCYVVTWADKVTCDRAAQWCAGASTSTRLGTHDVAHLCVRADSRSRLLPWPVIFCLLTDLKGGKAGLNIEYVV